ncbi:chemotaxis protein CheW [Acetivibrio straminisolvens]|uniref:chemotaxis protein CheW n=1 Tax=Acetivibrio straminisolvens TaxID=253314 RepID=UPI0006D2841A
MKGGLQVTQTEELEIIGQEEDTQKDKFLTFVLGKESYGIEIKNVTEIIGIQPITEVPELPDYIRGIVNLRGKIIPVVDMRLRFKKQFRDYNERTCIIVVNIRNASVGLIVDSVSEVIGIQEEDIVSPPDMNQGLSNKYIKGIAKVESEVKLLLDCNELLSKDEFKNLENIQ